MVCQPLDRGWLKNRTERLASVPACSVHAADQGNHSPRAKRNEKMTPLSGLVIAGCMLVVVCMQPGSQGIPGIGTRFLWQQ